MSAAGSAEPVFSRDAAEFDAWLDAHAGQKTGVWLKIARSASGIASLRSDEAVDVIAALET